MTSPEASAQTPLLSSVAPESEPAHQNPSSNDVENGVQFYDPSAILDISREVAFGYLILLTGGNVEYEPPISAKVSSGEKLPRDDSREIASKNRPKQSTLTIDEETASLAYGAIIDGNVLHACFGLKATSSGNPAVPAIGDNHNQLSLFCCFPATSATLQLVLPQAAKNKLKMQNLVEVLEEVRDLHYEAAGATVAVEITKVSLYMKVIQAYIHCFTAIVRYHDTKKCIKSDGTSKEGSSKPEGIIDCCSKILKKLNVFSGTKSNYPLDRLKNEALEDIEHGFLGLKEEMWESLESMAAETAFTGVSLEG
mmetsp:Transcript_31724/g.76836  ORF Transcript_31724/g.76836 Transcript_31724/m.76836 type:complete len:310 (-) Transcript_31724:348-1277(-)|eukprot:CAMPEP_0181106952 /NCGR_PEP_ID=MMETSP1071-20121207/16806_1 /TAXON_ID=35127 /ORGANISM="Thalassiosira sp., Strain NH16" /LENGTH=309 /DNA_ID=CAMNT_0023190393 /DNA_START=178 /DNA_END=1107 /DNA_ORIENTATION=+